MSTGSGCRERVCLRRVPRRAGEPLMLRGGFPGAASEAQGHAGAGLRLHPEGRVLERLEHGVHSLLLPAGRRAGAAVTPRARAMPGLAPGRPARM